MRWLPFWCHDKGVMANKRQQHRQTCVQGDQTRTGCLRRSDGLDTTRFLSATQGQADQSALQGSHHLCQSFFRTSIHAYDDKFFKRQNPLGKIGVATNNHVSIEHYHANNGRSADNAFIAHCNQQQQQLTYCGINAHFQNGIAERAICDIMEVGRKQLLHAMARWPTAVNLALWPYAMCYAGDLYNIVLVLSDGTSRLEKFSSTSVGACMRDHHTFACPVFVLQNAISAGNTIPRWSPHA